MLKKVISVLIISLLLCSLCACDLNEAITDAKDALIESERPNDVTTSNITLENSDDCRIVTMQDYGVSFELPNDWHVDMSETQLDLFCSNGDVHIGVYGYFTSDFADNTDYEDIWEEQCDSDLKRFKNVRKLDHDSEFTSTDKEIETVLYSAEYENIKQYVYYIYVKPEVDADAFLWLTTGGLPSDMRNNFDVIEGIIDSIKFGEVNM